MKKLVIFVAASLICLAVTVVAKAQTGEDAPSWKQVLSDKPFFGTRSVLTLSGDYVNSPKEDFEMLGVWNLPLTLDQMDGVVAGVAFGDGDQRGQWQLAYRRKLATTDTEWQAIADSSTSLTLSDRRSQVIKADYNVRDWWRLGVAAFIEDKFGDDAGSDVIPFLPNGRQSLGFQIDATLKF